MYKLFENKKKPEQFKKILFAKNILVSDLKIMENQDKNFWN